MGGQGAPIIWDFAPIHHLLLTKFLCTVCPSNINFPTTSLYLTVQYVEIRYGSDRTFERWLNGHLLMIRIGRLSGTLD